MSAVYDNSTIIQIQQANDIIDVVSEHISLKKKGREMVGICPFHEDHRPSMYVSPVKQIFKCFACGAGGDVFKFLQMRENLTFPQAVERLAERAGIKLKKSHSRRPRKQEQSDVDPNRLAGANRWALEHFKAELCDTEKGKGCREYLEERKLTPETIEKWEIGFADASDSLTRKAEKEKADKKILTYGGLLKQQAGEYTDRFKNRLMFPIKDVSGRVTGFGGRTLADADAKYINSPSTVLFDKSNSLYGLDMARHSIGTTGTAVVVEGYTDCIMAHQFGCDNTVATLGTSFTEGHARILKRFAKKIVLVFDNDTAGKAASNRALEVCLAQKIDIRVAFVEEGKDPCDYLLVKGKENFDKLIEGATDVFDFKWERLLETFNSDDTLVGRKRAVQEFIQAIAASLKTGAITPIENGLIVNRLAGTTGMQQQQILAELNKYIKRTQRSQKYQAGQNEDNQGKPDLGSGISAAAQREIIEVLLNEPDYTDFVTRNVSPEAFDVPVLKEIFRIICDIHKQQAKGDKVTVSRVLASTESVQLSEYIVDFADIGERKGNFRKRIEDAVERLKDIKEVDNRAGTKTDGTEEKQIMSIRRDRDKKNPHSLGLT
jgi:DNA primase